MSEFNTYPTARTTPAESNELREKIAELQIERNKAIQAKETLALRVDQRTTELEALQAAHRRLITSMQQDLSGFAESYLSPGDEDYKELSELMVNNGLDGLKRTFTVTVKVTYEFEVEVEATDEESARDEVDNNLDTHIESEVELGSYSDYDIEADEA